MTTRVGSLDNVNAWSKAGIMVRANALDARPRTRRSPCRRARIAFRAPHGRGGRTDASGAVIAHWPNVCLGGLNAGVNVFTVTVDDGQGHQTSDTMTVTAGSPGGDGEGTIVITAPAQGEVIPGGKPYTIRWTAPANMGGEELFVTVTTDGGAPSDHIWECTGSACRSAARSSSRITK